MARHRSGIHATFHFGECEALQDCAPKTDDRSCLQGYLRVLVLRQSICELNYAQQVLWEAPMKEGQLRAYVNAP